MRYVGSPLRMRGKVSNIPSGRAIIRITPAYAGKRSSRPIMNCLSQDHPCVCGEKLPIFCSYLFRLGSPLRMRGKVKALQWGYDNSRITPAYAGKRNVPAFAGAFFRDHPCVCGEKKSAVKCSEMQLGSPLRMRGKVILSPPI